MRQLVRGDRKALGALYDRFSARVYGLALALTHQRDEAEQVTRDVFIELWRTAARYDDQLETPGTWLMGLTHRRAADQLRWGRASVDGRWRPTIAGSDRSADPAGTELTAEAARVRAVGSLTDGQRDAIGLAYLDGHTYREVADLLGVPPQTVAGSLRDGLTRLRILLEPTRSGTDDRTRTGKAERT